MTMNSKTERGLTLSIEDASDEDLSRGLAAAFAVFDAARTTPKEAARADFDFEGASVSFGDADALPSPKSGAWALAKAWGDALTAAKAAARPDLAPEAARGEFDAT